MQQVHVNQEVTFIVCEWFTRCELDSHLVLLPENFQRELKNLACESFIPQDATFYMAALGTYCIHPKPLLLNEIQPYQWSSPPGNRFFVVGNWAR